jgi:very-short-patch-repair endonuclease
LPSGSNVVSEIRKEMTLPEVLLWQQLSGQPLGLKFRRQFPLLGHVIDFACVEHRLLIEIDGIAHDRGDRPRRDEERDAVLMDKGWRIVRIPAADVLKDPAAIASAIVTMADSRSDEEDFI